MNAGGRDVGRQPRRSALSRCWHWLRCLLRSCFARRASYRPPPPPPPMPVGLLPIPEGPALPQLPADGAQTRARRPGSPNKLRRSSPHTVEAIVHALRQLEVVCGDATPEDSRQRGCGEAICIT
ncbi:uncharacterized protein LOC126273504 [Schistocerca gregaria]|uniref:uncharacterized protein LOC126273504 n=1 Tax=Schistocerca gregaria TaxID=7010 RepID=UPI00211E5AC1|nr:uncharacterized protein LOC126273504 [Schistocerca gregaria]